MNHLLPPISQEQIESIIYADTQKLAPNDKRVLDYSKLGLPLTELNMMAIAQSVSCISCLLCLP